MLNQCSKDTLYHLYQKEQHRQDQCITESSDLLLNAMPEEDVKLYQ